MDDAVRLRIKLLGELSASYEGALLNLGGRRQRAVLAVLLLARGEVVPTERLASAVWGDRTPDDAASALQSYVSHLRRALQPGVPARGRSAVIVREGPGYAVRQPADAVDAWHFERLVAQADAAATPEETAALLEEALALWTGPALAEYADEPWAVAEIARLSELRAVARERLLAARLDLGDPALLVPELEMMVGDEPLREDRWRLLALALYRAHRQADALGALRRARAVLAEELGVDPGPGLRALEAEVLAQSPSLTAPPRPNARRENGTGRGADPSDHAVELVERDLELGVLAGALDDLCAGAHGLVLVEGPPGIGKTQLTVAAKRLAAARSVRVLASRGSQLETDFAFGVVRQLFEPALAGVTGREELLRGPAGRARGVFDLAPGEVADGFDVLHGLYWLTVNLTEAGPLLLVLDDVQWCDLASLRFLGFLVRRLEAVPLLVLATARPSALEPHREALLAELAHDPAARVLRPEGLSPEATARLVEHRLGSSPAPLFTAACHRTTSGNPLLLTQLLRALETDGVHPDAAHADRVVAMGSRALSSTVLMRLRGLSEQDVELARTAAVLGEGAPLPVLAGLAGLTETRTAEGLATLAHAGILRDQQPLVFAHPVVRDAVYSSLPAADRELRHERAATHLRAADASVEQVAAHLLLAPSRSDATVVELLRGAARTAAERGSSESALTYLRRALDEAPQERSRAELVLELGLVEATLDGPAGVAHLTEAYDLHDDPRVRGDIAIATTAAQLFASPPGVATGFARAARDRLPPELTDHAQALAALERFGGYLHGLESGWHAPVPPLTGEGPGARMLAAVLALQTVFTGTDRPSAVELARFALDRDLLLEADGGIFWVTAASVLMVADEDLGDFWSRARAAARARGSLFTTLSTSIWEGYHRWRRGELHAAVACLREGLEQDGIWHGSGVAEPFARAFQIGCHLDRGDLVAARQVAHEASPAGDGEGWRIMQQAVAGLLVAEGRHAEALATLDAAPQGVVVQNPAWHRWRGIRAQALAGLGRVEEALQLAEEEVRLLRSWGAPSALGASLLRLGQLRGTFDDRVGLEELRESVRLLATTSAEVDLARARCALGSRPELADQEAVELLLAASAAAEQRGARAVQEQARQALEHRGHPVPPCSADVRPVTSTEREVLELTAQGLDAVEVAQLLFLSPGTVRKVLDELDATAQVSLK